MFFAFNASSLIFVLGISKFFWSILVLAWKAISAAKPSAFKRQSHSLTIIFFMAGNDNEVKTIFYESTRLYCLGWSIIFSLSEFPWFSSSSCSSFLVSLSWWHCSCSLLNSDSKFISNLFITASYMDYVRISMFSLSSFISVTRYFMI